MSPGRCSSTACKCGSAVEDAASGPGRHAGHDPLTPVLSAAAFRAGGWDATSYVQRSHDEAPVSVMGSREESLQRQAGFLGQPRVVGKPGPNAANQCTGLYMLPLEYTTSSDEPEVRFRDPNTPLPTTARSLCNGRTRVGVNLSHLSMLEEASRHEVTGAARCMDARCMSSATHTTVT